MIEAIRYILRYSKAIVLLSAVASLVSGACNVHLVAMVGTAINAMPNIPPGYGARFVGLLLLTFASSVLAQLLSLHLTATVAARIRMQLSRAILDSPLRSLEEIGSQKMLAALTQDAGSIAQAAQQVSQFVTNATIIVSCLAYLAYVSLPIFLVVILMLPVSVGIYLAVEQIAVSYNILERENWDRLVKHFQTLISGIKELKLNRTRRVFFYMRQLLEASDLGRRYGVRGSAVYVVIVNWSNLLCFAAIGVIIFILPRIASFSLSALVGPALVALFLRTPVGGLFDALREFNRASVALNKLRIMGLPWEERTLSIIDKPTKMEHWRSIELIDVAHAYHTEDEGGQFILGPIRMTITPGRILFITGGNGSGKTTLAKLIVGLYKPESGVIEVDGVPVDDDFRDEYRQRFSAIFSEYALFEEVGDGSPESDEAVYTYLQLLRLERKVQLRGGAFSTTELSAGQRRRLALVHAYLEDRPIYLFDEWAADQDASFKEIFYCKLLPDLRGRGKAVIIISHDDRYYHIADEVIRLENGKAVAIPREPATDVPSVLGQQFSVKQ
jgi:putative pyoverdin transport system ATP-binding/permease protein